MLADELTLLDGTKVISQMGVAQLTGNARQAAQLCEQLQHETTLAGREYFNHADAVRLVAQLRGA